MTKTDLQNLTKWSKEQLAYMVILANPLEVRSDEEIATELHTTRQTLWNWRQIDGLVETAYEMMMKNLYGKLGKVFAGLIKRANQGDASAARIILETIGKLKSQVVKNETNIDNRSVTYIGSPEQNEEIKQFVKSEANRYLQSGEFRCEDNIIL